MLAIYNFGLCHIRSNITFGLMSFRLMTLDLMSFGLMTLGLKSFGLKSFGLLMKLPLMAVIFILFCDLSNITNFPLKCAPSKTKL